MQKILLAFALVACAGAEPDANAMNSLATLLLSRNSMEAFTPAAPAARFAMPKPMRSRPVAMKAGNSEPSSVHGMDLTRAFAQTAGLLPAMMPFMALADPGDEFPIDPFWAWIFTISFAATGFLVTRIGNEGKQTR